MLLSLLTWQRSFYSCTQRKTVTVNIIPIVVSLIIVLPLFSQFFFCCFCYDVKHFNTFSSFFFPPHTQGPATQTPATTEEHVRSARPTGATPSLATCASVHQASAESTASTVSRAAPFLVSLKNTRRKTW